MISPLPAKRLIVVGAGFAGINLVKQLRDLPLDILLIDKHNYHCFQPLLYQVATAALSPADIAHPIRHIFRDQKNVTVVLGEIDRVDLAGQQVCGGDVCVPYDYLALAVGSTHSYFGNEKWMPLAPGLKSVDDATQIRRQVLLAFEEAELEADDAARRAKLTFVVVGGGPTGVEMAGALREIAATDIPRDFRNIDTTTSRIILLQGGDRLLPQFHPKLSARAQSDLEAMGVEVRLNSYVTGVEPDGVRVGEQKIPAGNVIWAAGVQAPKVLSTLGVPQDRSGRIQVNPDFTIPGHPNVFVLGDAAHAVDAQTHQPLPGLAQAAIQSGRYVGRLLRDELEHRTDPDQRPPFHYYDKGMLATIGTRRAVADIRGWRFGGFFAWLLWSLVHITFLIGFRNKLFVMAGWIYDYLFSGREARLITGKFSLQIRRLRGPHTRSEPIVHLVQTGGPRPPDPVERPAGG
jgi:NADH dehydrogenase